MKIKYMISGLFIAAVIYSCTGDNNAQTDDGKIEVGSVVAELAGKDTSDEERSRAIADFAVNKDNLDPTSTLDSRTKWILDIAILKNGGAFTEGEGTFKWSTGDTWVSDNIVYFPNYLTGQFTADMYPSGWSAIKTDQSNESVFLEQDILEQNGTGYATITPAHIPKIPLRHAHSMLDFILYEVDPADISEVKVYSGDIGDPSTEEYDPYRVNVSDRMEYLVILPIGTVNPVVKITTNEGAVYYQQITISSTEPNKCYCIKLYGIELLLSTITVTNWVYGEALEGQFSTVTSYPAFRGPADTSCTVYYNNGESQVLEFNDRGECVAQPAGRTIVKLEYMGKDIVPDEPIVLRGMVIDLTTYLLNGLLHSGSSISKRSCP